MEGGRRERRAEGHAVRGCPTVISLVILQIDWLAGDLALDLVLHIIGLEFDPCGWSTDGVPLSRVCL